MDNNIKEVPKPIRLFVYIFNIISIFMTLAFLGVFFILVYIDYGKSITINDSVKHYWGFILGFIISLIFLYFSFCWMTYMGHYIQMKNARTETFRTQALEKLKKYRFFIKTFALGQWLINKCDYIEEIKQNPTLFTKEQKLWASMQKK